MEPSGKAIDGPLARGSSRLATKDVKIRMSDFAWATVHGFIILLLERQIGEGESSRGLKARGLTILADMAETVMRAGGVPD